jgi:hypothetical protein
MKKFWNKSPKKVLAEICFKLNKWQFFGLNLKIHYSILFIFFQFSILTSTGLLDEMWCTFHLLILSLLIILAYSKFHCHHFLHVVFGCNVQHISSGGSAEVTIKLKEDEYNNLFRLQQVFWMRCGAPFLLIISSLLVILTYYKFQCHFLHVVFGCNVHHTSSGGSIEVKIKLKEDE